MQPNLFYSAKNENFRKTLAMNRAAILVSYYFVNCSSERLSSELDKIKFILPTIGHQEHVNKSFMSKKKMKQMLCQNSNWKDDPSIYVSHGSVLFLPSLKSE